MRPVRANSPASFVVKFFYILAILFTVIEALIFAVATGVKVTPYLFKVEKTAFAYSCIMVDLLNECTGISLYNCRFLVTSVFLYPLFVAFFTVRKFLIYIW
jgi:hypothetical protein